MSRVFISYRRADSAQSASKLYRHLSLRFGKDLIFQDVEDIKPGDDLRSDGISRKASLAKEVVVPNNQLNADASHYTRG
jgi:hypothetical protein